MSARMLLWSVPAVIYVAFCYWYTDLSGPLSRAEIERYTAMLETNGSAPERIANIRRFMEADSGRQFIMVNVIDMADSPPSIPGAPPNATADDLMDRYMEHMYPELFKRACHPVFVGDAVFRSLDLAGIEGAEEWTRAALMRYRSRRDMLDIALNPAFSGPHEFKIAALDKTIAYPVESVLYLSDLRMLLLLALVAVVAVTDALIYGRR